MLALGGSRRFSVDAPGLIFARAVFRHARKNVSPPLDDLPAYGAPRSGLCLEIAEEIASVGGSERRRLTSRSNGTPRRRGSKQSESGKAGPAAATGASAMRAAARQP